MRTAQHTTSYSHYKTTNIWDTASTFILSRSQLAVNSLAWLYTLAQSFKSVKSFYLCSLLSSAIDTSAAHLWFQSPKPAVVYVEGQRVPYPNNKAYCYAELTISSPAMAHVSTNPVRCWATLLKPNNLDIKLYRWHKQPCVTCTTSNTDNIEWRQKRQLCCPGVKSKYVSPAPTYYN